MSSKKAVKDDHRSQTLIPLEPYFSHSGPTVRAHLARMLTHEIKHQAALLAFKQTQAPANLLLKHHGALCGSQQNQRVHKG